MGWIEDQFAQSQASGTGIYSWAGEGSGAAIGAAVGTAIPFVGTAIGTAVGTAADLLVGTTGTSDKKKSSGEFGHVYDAINNAIIAAATVKAAARGEKGFQQLLIRNYR